MECAAGPVERDQEADDPLAIEDEEDHDLLTVLHVPDCGVDCLMCAKFWY